MKKYISSYVLYLACGLTFLLSGCLGSATPNCSDGDTLAVLNEMVEEAFEKRFHGSIVYAPLYKNKTSQSLRALVDIEIRNIQTLQHEKNIDRYTCNAKLEFRLKGNKKADVVTSKIEYEVYAIEDRESNFEVQTSGIEEAIRRDLLNSAFPSRWHGLWK